LSLANQICQTLGEGLFFYSPYCFRSWQTTKFAKEKIANCWRCSAALFYTLFKSVE
jgi:hypothetical protein